MSKFNKTKDISPYGLCEWDYDSYTTPCNNYYGCITHINEGRITEVAHRYFYRVISNKDKIENIKDYCLDRFIRRHLATDSFEFEINDGYYGDEPGCSFNSNFQIKFDQFIYELNVSLDETSLIEAVLIDEYGFILDELKNKEWHFELINLENIIPAAGMRHTSQKIIDNYIKDAKFAHDLSCVCQKIGTKYRLIDGYHRYGAAKNLNFQEIVTIHCE